MLIAHWNGTLRPELLALLPDLTGYDCHDALLVLFGRSGGCVVVARAPLELSRVNRHGYACGILQLIQSVPDTEYVSLVLFGSARCEANELALLDEIRAEALAVCVHIEQIARISSEHFDDYRSASDPSHER